jgi:hypothetical protein
MNDAFRGERGQFLNRLSTTTTYVKNRELFLDTDMTQSPVRQFRVRIIHDPQKESSEPSIGFPNLIENVHQGEEPKCTERDPFQNEADVIWQANKFLNLLEEAELVRTNQTNKAAE